MQTILRDYQTKTGNSILNLQFIKNIVVSSDNLPQVFLCFMLIVEIGTLIILTNFDIYDFLKINLMSSHIQTFIMSKYYMTLELICILLAQLVLNASIYRLFYLKYFYHLMFQAYMDYVIVVLAVLAMIVDFLKTANCLIASKNYWSENYNFMKLLSYSINIAAVISARYKNLIMVGVLCGVALVQYVLRCNYRMINNNTQTILEAMCISLVSISFYNLITILNQQNQQFSFQFLVLLGFVTLHVFLKKYIFKNKISKQILQLDNLLKNGNLLDTIAEICYQLSNYRFQFLSSFDIKGFLQKSNNQHLENLNQQTKSDYLKSIYSLLVKHSNALSQNSQYWMIRAELEIQINKNIFGFLKIIQELELQIKDSKHSWLTSLMIVRLKQLYAITIDNLNQNLSKNRVIENVMEGFIRNYYLIEATGEAARAYSSFWEGLVNGYISTNNLNNALDQVVSKTSLVQQYYNKIRQHQSYCATEMYLQYLKFVTNQYKKCKEVNISAECLKSNAIDSFSYSKSMYISVSLQGNITKVGQNSQGLLSYKKSDLQGQSIRILIPKFCQLEHEKWFDELLQNTLQAKGIEYLIRFGKQTFCIDSNQKLKIVKLKFVLYIINEELVFSGCLKIESSPRIISFKGTGQILLRSDFNGLCQTEYINEQTDNSIDQIIGTLMRNDSVKISLFVNENIVTDDYSLFKVVSKQSISDNVYVIKSLQPMFINQTISFRKSSIIQRPSQVSCKKHFGKLQKIKQQYFESNSRIKTTLKLILMLLCITFVLFFTIKISTVNHRRNGSKKQIVDYLSKFQMTSLGIVNMVVRTFHIDFSVRQGIYYPSFDVVQISDLIEFITLAHKSFEYIANLPELVVPQYFQKEKFDGVSFQNIQTIVTNFDWMLMDILHYAPQNKFIQLTSYTAQNCQTFLFYLLPFYQQKLLQKAFNNALEFRRNFVIQIIVIPIAIFLQFLLLLICSRSSEVKSREVLQGILALENQDLAIYVQNIQKYTKQLQNKKALGSYHRGSIKQQSQSSNSQFLGFNCGLDNIDSILQPDSDRNFNLNYLRSNSSRSSSSNSGTNSMLQFIHQSSLQKSKSTTQPDQVQYKQNKKTQIREKQSQKRNYIMYSLFFVLTLAIMTNFGFYFRLTQQRWYSLKPYVQSIIALKQTFYSYQVLFTTLFLNFNLNNTKVSVVQEAIKNFTFSTQKLVKYDLQLFNLPGFEQFRKMKSNLDFQPICNYMNCRLYQDEFNVTYYSSIQHSYSKIVKVFDIYKQGNISYYQIYKTQPDMDYLVYSDQLYMEIINKTLHIAFKCLLTHIDNNQMEANKRILIHQVLVFLLEAVCIYQAVLIIWTRRRTIKILNLFKYLEQEQNIP